MFNNIFILIDTIALFFQGFSFRRGHVLMVLISSMVILSVLGLSIMFNGIGVYVNALLNIGNYGVMLPLAYVLFWWGSGYVIGCFQKVTKVNIQLK